jgi:hypothetical protein
MTTRAIIAALLSGSLLGVTMTGRCEQPAPQQAPQQPGAAAPTGPHAIPAQQAVQAMAGMAGIYRFAPSGDLYLYPMVKLQQNLYGMHGTYRVTPQGIILVPTGMEAPDMGMDSIGGVSGSFRVTPDGTAYFQSTPHAPVGMSGQTGRGSP